MKMKNTIIKFIVTSAMLFLSSCSNNNSDSVDSTDSTPSIIPEDAEYIATYGNYMYCALNLIDENSHAFLKIDTKTKRIDTLEYENDAINYLIEKYKALDDGIVYVIKDGYGNMEEGSLEFLQIPEDKVINIFDLLNTLSLDGTLGDVTFHSDYLSSSIRFVNNSEEAQATYEFTYDSFPFNISYSDLKNKKVISAIEQSAKSYINQNDNSWLTGTWKYQEDGVYIDNSTGKIKVLMTGEIQYNGSFEVEDNKLIYDRKNGYYSSLDIDWEGKCIGDLRHGLRFRKVSDQDVLRTQQTSNYRRSNNSSSNYSSSSTFRTDQDVYMYLSSHRFTSDGLTLSFGNGGTVMYSNGNPLSNAMRVVRFNTRQAVLSFTSPYSPGTKYITIDNQAGTLTDGSSGEVYYSR